MRKFIVGNWKMNGNEALIEAMAKTISRMRESFKAVRQCQQSTSSTSYPTSPQVVICPPFPYLRSLKECCAEATNAKAEIGIGAQNVHAHLAGAFTGEISAGMLRECGVSFCIIGHSERRIYFEESDILIQQKARILLEHEIRPVICIGESLEQREKNLHEKTVIGQLVRIIDGIPLTQLRQCIIAYEPLWAIGTGKTASAEQANEMHTVIRKNLEELTTEETAKAIPLLYGGSVNAKNASILLQQPEINGSLVGGASLKPEDFSQIIQSSMT